MATGATRKGLLEALAEVPDPRSRHGRRYQIASVLAIAVCAMACGARSQYAIAQWGKEHFVLVKEALGITRKRAPSQTTIHRVFTRLKVKAFEAVLAQWFQVRGLKPGEGIAIDGKTRRGLHGEEVPGVHLVCAYAHQQGIVLDQEAAPGKGQELAAVRALLKRLELTGQVVTGDAQLAQRDICTGIVEKGGTTCSG
jgi:DDE_Tnp_1-associated/Transposase DDE domain